MLQEESVQFITDLHRLFTHEFEQLQLALRSMRMLGGHGPTRPKRSLLPFVGNVMSSLFGTATHSQLREITCGREKMVFFKKPTPLSFVHIHVPWIVTFLFFVAIAIIICIIIRKYKLLPCVRKQVLEVVEQQPVQEPVEEPARLFT